MVTKPTYDDANLILRLYEMRREDKMRTARDWFAQNFHFKTMEDYNRQCPASSSMNAYSRMVMSYWEMIASFITSGRPRSGSACGVCGADWLAECPKPHAKVYS
jgi:hypothetical protein